MVSVVDTGPSIARDVVVTETVPAGLLIAGGLPPGCTAAGQVVRCELDDLTARERTSVTLVATTGNQVTGTITNEARVSSATSDPDQASNVISTSVVAISPPSTPPPPLSQPPNPANTGVPASNMAGWALLMLLAGAALTAIGYRRGRRPMG